MFEIARDRGSDKGHDGQHAEDEERQFDLQDGIRAVDGDLVAEVVDVNAGAGDRQKMNQREHQQRAEKEGRAELIANLELHDFQKRAHPCYSRLSLRLCAISVLK